MIGRNRLANVRNPYQGYSKKVLVCCSAGMLRSPTAAWVLSNPPYNFNTRAVGSSQEYALIPIDLAHCLWADEILCFEQEQKRLIQDILYEYNPNIVQEIRVLDIPDNFEYKDPKLIELLEKEFQQLYPQQ